MAPPPLQSQSSSKNKNTTTTMKKKKKNMRKLGKKRMNKILHDRRKQRERSNKMMKRMREEEEEEEGPSTGELMESSIPDDVFLKDMERFEEYTETLVSNVNDNVWLQKNRWNKVELSRGDDYGGGDSDDVVKGGEKGMEEGLVGVEVLDPSAYKELGLDKLLARRSYDDDEEEEEEEVDSDGGEVESRKKKKNKEEEEKDSAETVKDAKKKKKKKRKREETQEKEEKTEDAPFVFDEELMAAWEPYAEVIHEDVLENLQKLGFIRPTPVQQKTLELMVEDPQRNLIAAAETGSGKTLAFGIPLVSAILDEIDELNALQQQQQQQQGEEQNGQEIDDEDEEESDESAPKKAKIDGESEEQEGNVAETATQPPRKIKWVRNTKLRALVLTPTRELAIQVANHIKTITKDTPVICAAIVGGMSVEKQERILSYRPDIIVATPGRYWDLTLAGVKHLRELDQLRCICIDEADRMLAEGHFEEVYSILDTIKRARLKLEEPRLLQKFVLSATLTLDSKWREKSRSEEETSMVEKLLRILEMDDHSIIDLTPKGQIARTLQEAHVPCLENEKDTYLYYLLVRHPGRTIVFCNSISAVRHLQTLLTMLKLPVHALHGEMQQRQRLRNLDRFRGEKQSILVATDVAARGLDIPNVDSVVHFQIPRSVDTYVHRCGRTGRANKTGISVALVSPEERRNYVSICMGTNKEDGMEEFPVHITTIKQLAQRIKTANEIAKYELDHKKKKTNASWFQKYAAEADIELDDTFFPELAHDEEDEKSFEARRIMKLKEELRKMLSEQIIEPGISTKYVAADPNNLARARQIGQGQTIESVFTDKMQKVKDPIGRRIRKKNRFKRFIK